MSTAAATARLMQRRLAQVDAGWKQLPVQRGLQKCAHEAAIRPAHKMEAGARGESKKRAETRRLRVERPAPTARGGFSASARASGL